MVYSKSVRKTTSVLELQYQEPDKTQRSSRGRNKRRSDRGRQTRTAQTATRERGQEKEAREDEKDRRKRQDGTQRQADKMDITNQTNQSRVRREKRTREAFRTHYHGKLQQTSQAIMSNNKICTLNPQPHYPNLFNIAKAAWQSLSLCRAPGRVGCLCGCPHCLHVCLNAGWGAFKQNR